MKTKLFHRVSKFENNIKSYCSKFLLFIFFFIHSINLGGINSVQIESLKINNKEVKGFSNGLNLKIDDYDVFITLKPKEKIDSFGYQLVGFDKKVIYSPYPVIRYTNLEGGNYDLKIWACNNGTACDTIHLNLKVDKKFINCNLFKPALIAYLLLILSIFTLFWILDYKRQRQRSSDFRRKMNADLHDHIGGSLSSILTFSKMISKDLPEDNSKIKELNDEIINTSNESIVKLRETVRILKIKNKKHTNYFSDLIADIFHFIKILQKAEIEVEFEQNHDLDLLAKQKLSFARRENLNGMFHEICNNIVKHSKTNKVLISSSTNKEALTLCFQDFGLGFDTSNNYDGFGMQSLKQRAKESFVDLNIFSEPEKGTKICLVIPFI